MWEQMVLATGYQATLVTLPANEASTWLAQQLGGVIKMDSGPVRNLDVMVSLHKIELILCKPELKKSNQTKVRILILDPFKSSAWKIHLFDWGSWLIKQFKVIQFFCMVRTMLQQFFVMFTWSISKIDKSSIIDVPSLNAIFDHLGSPVDTGSFTALMLAIILDPYSRSKLLQQSLLWLCSWFNISLQGWVNRYTIVTCKNIDDIRSRVDGGSSIVLWLGLAIIIDRYSRSNIVAYYFFMARRFIWYESTYDRKTHSFGNHRSRVVQDRQWS